MKPTILALGLAGLASACVLTPEPGLLSPDVGAPYPVASEMEAYPEPVLYARDGTPVPASGPGGAYEIPPDAPAHGVQRGEQSRMYLLELYQETVDRKEALELEVRSLTADLRIAREELIGVQAEREAARQTIAELEAVRDRQREELRALAERLVTAQIRRLESDKLLLEAKIDWARTRQMIEAGAQDGDGKSGRPR